MTLFNLIEKKFIGHLLKCGNRAVALKIWLEALVILKREFPGKNVFFLVIRAVRNVRPIVIIKSRKRAGTVYQIPYLVQNTKRDVSTFLSIRWIFLAAVDHYARHMSEKLAKELKNAITNQGSCIKKKNDIYKLALQNRPYIRFLFPTRRKRRTLV